MMHIYIDESGSFKTPLVLSPKIACVMALILPSAQNEEILQGYEKIRLSWNVKEEIKGSQLNEFQIAQVIDFLSNYEAMAEVCAIDIGAHTKQDIENYQRAACRKITENLTPKHYPKVIVDIFRLRKRLAELSPPLAIQFFLTIALIQELLQTSTIYYSQKLPEELEKFHWIVDAKDKNSITNYEKLWTLLILPTAVQKPFYVVDDYRYNYSFLDRFSVEADRFPYTIEHLAPSPDSAFHGFNLKMIMQENFSFSDSRLNIGLQLVDIVASAFTRAMNGNLQKKGWENIGKLFLRKPSQILKLASLDLNQHPYTPSNLFRFVARSLQQSTFRNLLPADLE
jgi:Protein of unknown function (DUF3800)